MALTRRSFVQDQQKLESIAALIAHTDVSTSVGIRLPAKCSVINLMRAPNHETQPIGVVPRGLEHKFPKKEVISCLVRRLSCLSRSLGVRRAWDVSGTLVDYV